MRKLHVHSIAVHGMLRKRWLGAPPRSSAMHGRQGVLPVLRYIQRAPVLIWQLLTDYVDYISMRE